jgi:hypothetical protein
MGTLIRRCPHCRELVDSQMFMWAGRYGHDFEDSGRQMSFCANCNAVLETWYRQRSRDQPAEYCTRTWRWNNAGNEVATTDPLFEDPAPGEGTIKWMNKWARENDSCYKKIRWERQLSGPLYQYDDRLVTVSLCKADVSAATLEPMIELIRSHFKKRKAGALRKREETATTVELRFYLKGPEDWAIFELRRKGKLPWSTTVWRHNAGRRYEVREWDGKNGREALPPSANDLAPRPRKAKPADKSGDPLAAAVKRLIDKFREIGEDNPEIEDTVIRDETFDAIVRGFIIPEPGYVVPSSFGLDDTAANRKVQRAIQRFIKDALPVAAAGNLSAQQRLDAINEPSLEADDFFGYCDDAGRLGQAGE